MQTVIYTTMRTVIEHDKPFSGRDEIYQYIPELIQFENTAVKWAADKRCSVAETEVVEDEIMNYNMESLDK